MFYVTGFWDDLTESHVTGPNVCTFLPLRCCGVLLGEDPSSSSSQHADLGQVAASECKRAAGPIWARFVTSIISLSALAQQGMPQIQAGS
jgi:hypothetical protein